MEQKHQQEKTAKLVTIDVDGVDSQNPTYDLMPSVIRPEINFLRFPFFALSKRGLKSKTKNEYRLVEERGGEQLELLWRVSANAELGYPSPFDRRVHHAVNAIIDETIEQNGYPLQNPIQFSIYQLTKLMRFNSVGGSRYRDIKSSLLRIKFTGIESKGSFYLKDRRRWIHDAFNLYDRVVFRGEELLDDSIDDEIAETNYIWLSDFYLRNLNAQYVRPLDYQYLVSLKNDIASRLYELLSGKFFGLPRRKKDFQISYQDLCESLPLMPQKYISLAKQKLNPAHQELIKTGFLSNVSFRKASGKKDFIITYYLGKRAERERRGELVKKFTVSADEQYLLPLVTKDPDEAIQLSDTALELHNRGVSRSKALKLVQNYDESRITSKIANFDLLQAIQPLDNPAGWLISSIEDDYELTDKQKQQIKSEAQRRSKEGLESKAQTIADQRIQEALETFPTKEQWVENHITEAKQIRSLLVKQIPNSQPFSDQELDKLRVTAATDYPTTQEERLAYIKRNSHKYNTDPDDIIKELGQQA